MFALLAAQLLAGSALYTKYCVECHGEKLQGAAGPSLVESQLQHGTGDSAITRSIRDGYPQNGMPPWGKVLSAKEIRSLVVYLFEQRSDKHPLAERMTGERLGISGRVVQSEAETFRAEVVVNNGLSAPWSLAVLPDRRILVTERFRGELRVIENGGLMAGAVQSVPPNKGLLDVRLHPDYLHNGYVYLSFVEYPEGTDLNSTDGDAPVFTCLARGRIRDGRWLDSRVLLRLRVLPFTGRIAFDGDGYVYLSTGVMTGSKVKDLNPYAQDLSRAYGKIHRIYDDGRIPADNPFGKRADALASIWSYGHRNPQGLAFDRSTKLLWSTEHGPRGGDELNLIRPGLNYGWPVITYGTNYDGTAITDKTAADGMEQPIYQWTPSIAVSSITFYHGSAFPHWRNELFITSLKEETLYRFVLSGKSVAHQEMILKDAGRQRDIAVGPDGFVYVLLERPGRIIRLIPASLSAG